MCGITGYYSENKKIDLEDLKKMTSAISHRGPDAEGYFTDKFTGLGHKRLSILDLSQDANQPMYSKCGKFVIVYNGEVYNYKEIAVNYNINTKTNSDTEVILEHFINKGVDFVNDLNGMFAIVIYDRKTNDLYIFRDRIGIKPLFYFWDGALFAFASELKALLQLSCIDKQKTVNINSLNQFLQLGYIPEPETFFNNIYKFPAGSYARLRKNKLEIKKYWNVYQKINQSVISDFNDAKTLLDNLINDSVKKRLISDVPVGTLLSGGIDSSLVTAIAQKHTSHNIKTFSIGFKEVQYNETEFASKISKYLGTEHNEYILSEKQTINYIDDLINQYDEPFADSSAIPFMLVSSFARRQVTVTLSGDGGDELFHGYGAYIWANRLSNPFIKVARYPISYILKFGNNRLKRAAKVFQYHGSNGKNVNIFSQEQFYFSDNEIKNLLNKSFYRDYEIKFPTNYNRKLTGAEIQALFDINYYLKDDLLVKVDRASMKYALEDRVPLLDHRIVEFAVNISPNLKIFKGIQKCLLKELLYDYLPKEYFERPKWGFSIPLIKWLKSDLKYLVEDLKTSSKIVNMGIINKSYMDLLIKKYYKGEDYLYNRIWQLIILDKIYRKYNL